MTDQPTTDGTTDTGAAGGTEDDQASTEDTTTDTGTGTTSGTTYDEAYVRKLRDEAASHRVKAKDAETKHTQTLDAIAKALGLASDETPDPAKLTEQLTASQAEARTLKVERALGKAAHTHGADEDLLAAVLAHKGKLGNLDPTAADFATTVDALVKETVAANPKLRATGQGPARSGGDHTGGTGQATQPQSVDDFRKARTKWRGSGGN